jgi:HlyD family secretion protein
LTHIKAGIRVGRHGHFMARKLLIACLALVLLAAAGGGAYLWWRQFNDKLPPGIAWGNGRIEADDIDITPKYAGRIAELLVEEGDLVKAGQIVARMDTRDLEASLRRAEAEIRQAQHARQEAEASIEQQKSTLTLARQEFERTRTLLERGFATRELYDQRRQQIDVAAAGLKAATARAGEAEHAIDAARQAAELYKINIAEGVLTAPRDARVLYRLVATGEVVGAGAKIFTLLDISSVYMTVFLPTEDAGKVALGAEGRIVLDAYPALVIPAAVSFVSAKSQFTPKTVETRSERDKLMFRVKVRIAPDLLARHAESVRTGLPGIAYIRTDAQAPWPARLAPNVPP